MKYLIIIISLLILTACEEEETKPTTSTIEEEVVEKVSFIWHVEDVHLDSLNVETDSIRYSLFICCIQNPFKEELDKKEINKSIRVSNTLINFEDYYTSQILDEFFSYDSIININPFAFESPESRLVKIKTNKREKTVDFRIILPDVNKERQSSSDFPALFQTSEIWGQVAEIYREKMIEEEFRE